MGRHGILVFQSLVAMRRAPDYPPPSLLTLYIFCFPFHPGTDIQTDP